VASGTVWAQTGSASTSIAPGFFFTGEYDNRPNSESVATGGLVPGISFGSGNPGSAETGNAGLTQSGTLSSIAPGPTGGNTLSYIPGTLLLNTARPSLNDAQTFSYSASSGSVVITTFVFSPTLFATLGQPVPEPSTAALLSAGMIGVAALRRRRALPPGASRQT
jgi:hypothetical protein